MWGGIDAVVSKQDVVLWLPDQVCYSTEPLPQSDIGWTALAVKAGLNCKSLKIQAAAL